MQTRMTAAEYRQYLFQQQNKKPAKHRNKIVFVYEDGFVTTEKDMAGERHGAIVEKYDSIKEYQRWGELQILQKGSRISHLRKQVALEIAPAYTDAEGKKHQAAVYKADFCYIENGKEIVEDVKALDQKTGKFLTTSTFNLKWKLLQAKYPEKTFRLY